MIYIIIVAFCVALLLILLSQADEYNDKPTIISGIVFGVIGVIFMILVANDFRIERNQLIVLAYDNNITLHKKYDGHIEELLVKRYRNTLKD